MIRNIEDIEYRTDKDDLIAYIRDMRGKAERKNVLDFSAEELYHLLLQAYELGDRDARRRIKDALDGRSSYN
jgi:hypothetical protein